MPLAPIAAGVALLALYVALLSWLGLGWPLIALAVVAPLGYAIFKVRRVQRTLARVQGHLRAGEPEPMLALVESELHRRKSLMARVPLLIFKASGQSMRGDWRGAMETLDGVDLEALRRPGAEVWLYGYLGTRFECLIFLERTEEARRIYERELLPLCEGSPALRDAAPALEMARAHLAFSDGELAAARASFVRLLGDERVPPAGSAVFHYFLGRIERETGADAAAEDHFARAAALAPRTWIPAGIHVLGEAPPNSRLG